MSGNERMVSKNSITDYWYNLPVVSGNINPLNINLNREYSVFSGWYFDSNFTDQYTGVGQIPYVTENTTFYAKWDCME
jgi:uncharacterized repeat protein (TIGR02543 family)